MASNLEKEAFEAGEKSRELKAQIDSYVDGIREIMKDVSKFSRAQLDIPQIRKKLEELNAKMSQSYKTRREFLARYDSILELETLDRLKHGFDGLYWSLERSLKEEYAG